MTDPLTPPPPASRPEPSLFALRTRARPLPRFGSVLAVAGALLTVFGLLVWTVTYYVDGLHSYAYASFAGPSAPGDGSIVYGGPAVSRVHSDDRKWLGFAVFLALVMIGAGLAWWRKRGPLASAGSVAAALAVPITMTFGTVSGAVVFFQIHAQVDSVYLVSVVAWLVGYVALPGLRGRSFLLAFALTAIVEYIALKIGAASHDTVTRIVIQGGSGHAIGGVGSHLDALGALGLAFGLFYYVVAVLLDLAGRAGISVGFVVAGFITTVGGLAASAHGFGQTGTGIALLLIGALLALYGARAGRRFTAWTWLGVAVLGVGVLVADAVPDRAVAAGVTLAVIGALVAVAAQLGSTLLHERPEYPELPH